MQLLKFFIISLIFTISSCNNSSEKDPENIGKQVFNVVKKLSRDSKADFVKHFMSVEELRELGKNEEVISSEYTRNEMTSIRKEGWNRIIESYHTDLKSYGAEYGVKWDDIEYLDFVYEIKKEDGAKSCEGYLYFTSNEITYKVKSVSIYTGKEYKLMKIGELFRVD